MTPFLCEGYKEDGTRFHFSVDITVLNYCKSKNVMQIRVGKVYNYIVRYIITYISQGSPETKNLIVHGSKRPGHKGNPVNNKKNPNETLGIETCYLLCYEVSLCDTINEKV